MLETRETQILEELLAPQGQPVEIGGYFHPDDVMASRAMRPSAALNAIIDSM
jgi:isocitrate dehydrogenase